ncbi:MAG TPA: hypothetical protein VI413_00620 [Paludibacter sp.]
MAITQEPEANGLYFQKNIPDIIIQKEAGDIDMRTLELLIDGISVISEKYVFDTTGEIRIRNIGDIVEKYFTDSKLILPVSFSLTDEVNPAYTIPFQALKCESDMIVEASSWTATNFLTRAYREKRTSKSNNEYLSFLHRSTYGFCLLRYRIVYLLNGIITELTGFVNSELIGIAAADKITTFNASAVTILTYAGLAPETEVIQYDLWITGLDFEMNKYTFLVDYSVYRNKKYFVFINSFGVLETFTGTGQTDTKKTPEYSLGNIKNHYRKLTQDFVAEKTAYSGFLSDVEMEWIDDLLISYDVALYTPGVTGAAEEITFTTVEKTDTEANVLQAFSFSYRRADNNNLQFTNAAKGVFDNTFDETFN